MDDPDWLVTVFDWGMHAFTWLLVVVFGGKAAEAVDGPFRPACWLYSLLALGLAATWIWARPWAAPLTCFLCLVFAYVPLMIGRRLHLALRAPNVDRSKELARRLRWLIPNRVAADVSAVVATVDLLLEGRRAPALDCLDDASKAVRLAVTTDLAYGLAMADGHFASARDHCLEQLESEPESDEAAAVAGAFEAMLWMPDADGCVELFETHLTMLKGPTARASGTLDRARLTLAATCGLEDEVAAHTDVFPLTEVDRSLVEWRCAVARGVEPDRAELDALRRDATPIQRWMIWHIASMEPYRPSDDTIAKARKLLDDTRSRLWASPRGLRINEWIWSTALIVMTILLSVAAYEQSSAAAP